MDNLLQEEKVFKDPVHKYIYVQDQIIWDLINSKEFQRLRRIRQMGTSFFTFHGAEHSRFSHSLGVYEITRKIISLFERNQYSDWFNEDRLLCLCSALLHDVGHGPFSHSIERAFGIHHEDWSCAIILGDTTINQILTKISTDFPQKVADVINKSYPNKIVVSLISSQMDADRMDYLLRDAYYTGVNYGTFDLERILRMLRPHEGEIVIKESGMHTVEDYLMSRYQMYWQVYFHPVTRSSEIVLKKLFQRAKSLYKQGFPFRFLPNPLPMLFDGTLEVNEYLVMDEAFIQMTMEQWSTEEDAILVDLCRRFLDRRLFKYISLEIIDPSFLERVTQQMVSKGLDPDIYLEIDFPSDSPYDVYRPGDNEEKLPIKILTEKNQLIEISQRSEIVRSISGIHVGTHQLYYPGDFITLRNTQIVSDDFQNKK